MTMRGGAAYVASLRDGRAVFLDGERVDDVTKHPAFVEPIRRIAETYDSAMAAAADPALTFADPTTGTRHSNMWLVPRSADDLGARRRVHRFWAEPSFGLMGRTPEDRKSTRLNSSHVAISYAVFCLKKKNSTYN